VSDSAGPRLPEDLAHRLARVALRNVRQEYPNKPEHVLNDPKDLRSPRALHPIFYGSYDWHSSVHMHWSLARLLRCNGRMSESGQIVALFDSAFTPDNVALEIAYLQHPSRRSFERTYGWSWLLKLQAELIALAKSDPEASSWRDALQPFAELIVRYYQDYLPIAQYPVRSGTHANSAFGLMLALDYAERIQHLALRKLIATKANTWFGHDRRYPASYEPGGDDFLSAGLIEAALMLRLVDACSYADWWELFCPSPQDLQTWLSPLKVTDRSDPKLAHLDGVNLARAWCWKKLLPQLSEPLRTRVKVAVESHLDASLVHAVRGHYAGTHWLASFALLALTE